LIFKSFRRLPSHVGGTQTRGWGGVKVQRQVRLLPQWDRTHLRTVAFVQEDTKDTILQGISARLCAMCGGNGSGTFLGAVATAVCDSATERCLIAGG